MRVSLLRFPGLKDRERTERQNAWMDGHYKVVTATISFGMGVDKPSVRYKYVRFKYTYVQIDR